MTLELGICRYRVDMRSIGDLVMSPRMSPRSPWSALSRWWPAAKAPTPLILAFSRPQGWKPLPAIVLILAEVRQTRSARRPAVWRRRRITFGADADVVGGSAVVAGSGGGLECWGRWSLPGSRSAGTSNRPKETS